MIRIFKLDSITIGNITASDIAIEFECPVNTTLSIMKNTKLGRLRKAGEIAGYVAGYISIGSIRTPWFSADGLRFEHDTTGEELSALIDSFLKSLEDIAARLGITYTDEEDMIAKIADFLVGNPNPSDIQRELDQLLNQLNIAQKN